MIGWIMRRMAFLLIAALAQDAGKDCAGFASQAESV
jgi:hypothetical protein